MSYRNSFSTGPGRASPYAGRLGHDDRSFSDLYEYVDPGDLNPRGGHTSYRSSGSDLPLEADDAPDVIHVKYMGTAFHLEFPPYSISESTISTGELRRRIAEELGTDRRRVRLVYKDRDLIKDNHPIKHYGCKQNSEVQVVITEHLNDHGGNPSSGEENGHKGGTLHPTATHERRRPRGNSSVRHRSDEFQATPNSSGLLHPLNGQSYRRPRSPSPAAQTHKRDRSRSPAPPQPSALPAPAVSRPQRLPPADPNTPLGKVQALQEKFYDKWLPESQIFLASPPSDLSARDKERKRLGECVMRYVVEAADAIEIQGDQTARAERKSMLNAANELVKKLDHMVMS